MKQQALAYTFLILGVLAFTILVALLVAAWSTVVVISHLVLWGVLALATLMVGGVGWHKLSIAHLERKARQQALRIEAEKHELDRHLALTRLGADSLGNYPIYLAPDPSIVPLIFAPGNSLRGSQKGKEAGGEGRPIAKASTRPQLPAHIPTFAELLHAGHILPYEEESILGYSHGLPRRGPWAKLHSFLVVGLSGMGKSSTVAYYAALAVLHGARLLIIDPDAEEEESISHRLAPLSFALLTPVASTPPGAARVLDLAAKELEHPSSSPVVWIIDEFSSIMSAFQRGGPWAPIAERLALDAENWAQRGRKRGRTTIVIGQIAKASRTGGTELRASMTATFIHRIPAQQARLVIDSDSASVAPELDVGEVMVQLANAAEPYRMHIPYATHADMQEVARLMSPSPSVHPSFTPRSSIVQFTGRKPLETADETGVNAPLNVVERVRALSGQGRSKRAIIAEMWGARPGGTQAWQEASRTYDAIVTQFQDEPRDEMDP